MIEKLFIINNISYNVKGYSQEMADGTFQSMCSFIELNSDHALDKKFTLGIFHKDKISAEEDGFRYGLEKLNHVL
jgi:hypothetical protein